LSASPPRYLNLPYPQNTPPPHRSYTYDDASDPKWQNLLRRWVAGLPEVRELLGGLDYPLIWTADFILDTSEDGSDTYRCVWPAGRLGFGWSAVGLSGWRGSCN
jgi:hypothetical protein